MVVVEVVLVVGAVVVEVVLVVGAVVVVVGGGVGSGSSARTSMESEY